MDSSRLLSSSSSPPDDVRLALAAPAASTVRWAPAAAYTARALRTEKVSEVRELLLKERSEYWQSTDNLYPSLILLVYVPQAVSCLPLLDSDANRRWCGMLLLITCALNLLYLLIFLIASRVLYSTIDRQRDAAQMLRFWLQERRTNIGVRERLLLAVVLLDLGLTLVQLFLLWVDRAPLQQQTSPDGLLPFLTTTYVWVLASAVSLYRGMQQLWYQLRAVVRAVRGESAGTAHRSSRDAYYYKDDGVLQWSAERRAWVQLEPGLVLRCGSCLIRGVQAAITDRTDTALLGVLRFEARTEATWTGAYVHFWLQWWKGDERVMCSMDMEEEQGLLPHNVMFKLLFPDTTWRTFDTFFAIDLHHESVDAVRDSDLGDRIRFCYAA